MVFWQQLSLSSSSRWTFPWKAFCKRPDFKYQWRRCARSSSSWRHRSYKVGWVLTARICSQSFGNLKLSKHTTFDTKDGWLRIWKLPSQSELWSFSKIRNIYGMSVVHDPWLSLTYHSLFSPVETHHDSPLKGTFMPQLHRGIFNEDTCTYLYCSGTIKELILSNQLLYSTFLGMHPLALRWRW